MVNMINKYKYLIAISFIISFILRLFFVEDSAIGDTVKSLSLALFAMLVALAIKNKLKYYSIPKIMILSYVIPLIFIVPVNIFFMRFNDYQIESNYGLFFWRKLLIEFCPLLCILILSFLGFKKLPNNLTLVSIKKPNVYARTFTFIYFAISLVYLFSNHYSGFDIISYFTRIGFSIFQPFIFFIALWAHD